MFQEQLIGRGRGIWSAIAAMLLLCSGVGACTTNPATGRSQLDLISRAEEIKIGETATPELISQYGGRIDDSYMQAYVSEVGKRLARHVEGDYAELPWEFIVLDSEVINAFALPGGKVFITKGLLVELEDEAQLAGVLGHEIGHVTAEHADKRMSQQMVLAGVLVGTAVAVGTSDSKVVSAGVPLLVGATGQGFLLKFGRGDEIEADALGMRYMSRAGYDPAAQRDVMEILRRASDGQGRPPELLSTHPYPETRIARIEERLGTQYPPEERATLVRNQPQYEQNVLVRALTN